MQEVLLEVVVSDLGYSLNKLILLKDNLKNSIGLIDSVISR
jgi:hypothetical protein